MISIEFISHKECPNTAAARGNLIRALAGAGISARWTEWEYSSPETPAYAREFGSPAILVNGRDIAGLCQHQAASCRIYENARGTPSGVPPVELIAKALSEAQATTGPGSNGRAPLKRHLPLVPAVAVALLPKVACPACWPAYVGLLSVVGLGFLAQTELLFPLTIAFLVIVLIALAYGTRRSHDFRPLVLGAFASAAILLGKFGMNSGPLFYTGLALLVGSSLWNTWPRREFKTDSCCECAPAGNRSRNERKLSQ